MIEIAPSHKRGLQIHGPVMNAAGCAGFAEEYRHLVDFAALGAFVTNPITARPRTPARGARVLEFPGGALIHTGLPNPGVRRAIQLYARKWSAMPCPVLVHLAATIPSEVAECMETLETVESVAGVELGLDDGTGPVKTRDLVVAAVASGSLPVIVRVPFEGALECAQAAQSAGAVALTVAGPPRGRWQDAAGEWVSGRTVGAAFAPLALHRVCAIITVVPLPVIACGGIHDAETARAFLAAGAVAVQVDAQLWRDPARSNAIATALQTGAQTDQEQFHD